MEQKNGKLELIATHKLKANPEIYKIVDFLNKNLKDRQLMFGLSKKEENMIISVYEVE
jgi:uncharacterized FlaG/YvyC family protein